MKTPSARLGLAEINASLRETVAALTDALQELLDNPTDPAASIRAKLVLAKVKKLMRQFDGAH